MSSHTSYFLTSALKHKLTRVFKTLGFSSEDSVQFLAAQAAYKTQSNMNNMVLISNLKEAYKISEGFTMEAAKNFRTEYESNWDPEDSYKMTKVVMAAYCLWGELLDSR